MLREKWGLYRFLWLSIGVSAVSLCASENAGAARASLVNMNVQANVHKKMPLLICWLAEHRSSIEPLMPVIKRDFMFSNQLEVQLKQVAAKPSSQDIRNLFTQGYSLVLFVTQGPHDSIEWRLFDTLKGTMIEGKRCIKRSDCAHGWAHQVADSVWPTVTGQGPFFTSKIAYCKQIDAGQGRRIKQVWIADYDGNNEQILVDVPTITVAPRWNYDMTRPLLFYSEYTNDNIRLMSCTVDTAKKRSIASNFDGINMLPAFSREGKKVAYCASHGKGMCQLYYGENGNFRQITHNAGNNISPSLFDDGSALIFCSDFQTGKPQIYQYTVESELIERITDGGYCASPSYCGKRHQIAYGKVDHGVMQLYLYDVACKTHVRLTDDAGSKEEYSWSPCGNYILFSVEQAGKSRVAVLNLLTKERKYITPEGSHCSYPAWSPLYSTYVHA